MAEEEWWYCACKWCCTNNGFVGCYSVFGFVERVRKFKLKVLLALLAAAKKFRCKLQQQINEF
jgi:hypothetical protein